MKELFFHESGQQNTQSILFLHASGSSSQMWRHHFAVFEQDFHCIAVDLPGHGSSRDIEWTDFDEVAEMIVTIIKSRAHGRPHLVGLSLGGSLILKLLEKHASLVDKVIVDGASSQPIKGYCNIITLIYLISLVKNRKFIANLMTKMMRKDDVSEEVCRTFVKDLQRASTKSFRRAMSQANLLQLDLSFNNPAFFVSGEKEFETMHESHQVLAQQNAGSECAYYPGKGHAWLLSDFGTHIQLLHYFLQNDKFPQTLRHFASKGQRE